MGQDDPQTPPLDGRARLGGFLGALEAIGLAGFPWLERTPDGPAVDGEMKEQYWRVFEDIVAVSEPDIPWQWGCNGLLAAASALMRRPAG